MKTNLIILLLPAILILSHCNTSIEKTTEPMDDFIYQTEKFADIRILRYTIPDFDSLSLQQKTLVYYLHEAAMAGRDIIWDQNYRHNLTIRKTLEEIIKHYNGDRNTPEFDSFLVYCKRIFVANGIHHHNSTVKILPEFDEDFLIRLVNNSPDGSFPVKSGEDINSLLNILMPIIFNPDYDAKRVNLDPSADLAAESANNFYENLTQDEVTGFYNALSNPDDPRPLSYGLNSKLLKRNNVIEEKIWKVNGMYSQAIERIIYWLEKAVTVAENPSQRNIIRKLIEFYETGDLAAFDEYSILWVQDTVSYIDFTNGFIEVYGDPFGRKGSYQGMVSIKDTEASRRTQTISENAQWFEDNLPVKETYRKPSAVGIAARAINVTALSGDNSPTPPLGVNLPNAEWIRRDYGSKSVTISNLVSAYSLANKESGVIQEFSFNDEEVKLAIEFGELASSLHIDMHEIIGHGSGQLKQGVADMAETLKNYASVIEEARADLVGLYFIMDPKLIELGLIPSLDAGKAQYNQYIKNGLMIQLYRINPGSNIEQAHMRNRQLITAWVYEKGMKDNVIQKLSRDNKTFFTINDHNALRKLFGQLLSEIQKIKSEGDFRAAKDLVEKYGVKANQELLKEVHERYSALGVPPHAAFINPVFIPVIQNDRTVNIKVEYPTDFLQQMMYYGEKYSNLPIYN